MCVAFCWGLAVKLTCLEKLLQSAVCSVLVFLLLLYAVNVLLKSCNISRAPSNDRNLITGKFAEVIHSALV